MSKIELYNENCLDVLDRLIADGRKVDLIVNDPPYKVISGGNKSPNSPKGCLAKNDGKIFEHNDLKEEEWFPKIYEILKDNAHCYIMTNTLNLERYLTLSRKVGFKLHNLLVWKKNNVLPNRWYMKNCEYTLFLRKGKAFSINELGSKTVHEIDNVNRNREHPTEKPVELMELYVKNSSKEGETVLDFTMGGGSTGVACKNLNRNFIGIEIDKKYFEIAKNRLSGTEVEDLTKQTIENNSDILF